MKNASSSLIAFLNSLSPGVQPYIADLLTIIQVGGATTRLTSAPGDVLSTSQAISKTDANVYTFLGDSGVSFIRGQVTQSVGLEVDNMPLTIIAPTSVTIAGVPWPTLARQGGFDGAKIVVERLFMATWGDTSKGTVIVFSGNSGEVYSTRNAVQITVMAATNILALPMPRIIYQPGCNHMLYDTGCTLLQATYTSTGTAHAGSTASSIATGLSHVDHYYELGAITFTSGVNSGISRSILTYISNVATVAPPFPSAPATGDSFSIYPGCDKSQGTCTTKFANLSHFMGLPYVPTPEMAL